MTIPNRPYVFQVAWDEANPTGRWEHPYSNYLTDLVSAQVQRNAIHTQAQPDTLQVVARDPDQIVKPLKASSPLWPHVQRLTKCRLLARKPDLSFKTAFYGTIDNLTPDSSNRTQPLVTIDLQSPMVALNDLKVTVPLLTDPLIWSPGYLPLQSALGALLDAAGLYSSPNTNVDPVGLTHYGGDWGGGQVTFGAALADLADKAQVVIYAEFLLPPTDADPHWRLRWRQPQPTATPDFSWAWTAGTLEQKPVLKYGTEARR